MIKRRIPIAITAMTLLLVATGSAMLFSATAGPHPSDGRGPWVTVVGTSGSTGYLVNTNTGEAWLIDGTSKRRVVEHAVPGKP